MVERGRCGERVVCHDGWKDERETGVRRGRGERARGRKYGGSLIGREGRGNEGKGTDLPESNRGGFGKR